jgi:hypothetical protein
MPKDDKKKEVENFSNLYEKLKSYGNNFYKFIFFSNYLGNSPFPSSTELDSPLWDVEL